jgi:hypothetical protein
VADVTVETFLADLDVPEIPWARPTGAPIALRTDRVFIGSGIDALEIALATVARTGPGPGPRVDEVRRLWNARWNRRAAPVALIVAYQDGAEMWKAAICGTKDDPAVLTDLDLAQVERICAVALTASDPANAERALHRLLVGQKDHLVAGLVNSGLFASYELRTGVRNRPDWISAGDKAITLLSNRGADLIRGLGYTATPHGSVALILSDDASRRAVAVLLDDTEMFDRPATRFGTASPVSQGLAIAQQQGLDWLLITRGTQIRLYSAVAGVGVGRKGQSETYAEIDLALLANADAGYLTLLLSAEALAEGGSVAAILAASADHAAALGRRLRKRVYEDVIPSLAVAMAKRMHATSESDLEEAYHRTLLVLFRLLFVSYAEDRGLLPYQRNPRYTKKALKTLARELAADPKMVFDPEATDRWEDIMAVWRAVDDGKIEWDVPAYNGGLFAADKTHPSGQALATMHLTNAEIGPALRSLLIDAGDDGIPGPVDFRSLSVREFGTIYEGLLESSLSIASVNLRVDPITDAFLPSKSAADVTIPAGEVYYHNASGSRKASGSYFTKAFAVEHLLDTALEPAIAEHLARVSALLDAGDDAKAAESFFDFRIADLAMGSGHFLVAAIDRIERQFSAFLVAHSIPTVTQELRRLSETAHAALGVNAITIEIEPSALLRRQIARRCVYGLDLNIMAVELARLGIWIHTFVPGLPMSALDHGLVVGNSLTGIGTVEEVLDVLEPQRTPGQYSLFAAQIDAALSVARDRLVRIGRTAEATKQEVRDAGRAHAEAMEDAADAKALLDAAVAVRIGAMTMPSGEEAAITASRRPDVQARIAALSPAHMPYLFPEVFLRSNPGFDVILGNPPWEKVRWEAAPFWVGVLPGLMAMPDKIRDAKIEELRISHPLEASEERRQQAQRAIQQNLFKKSYTLRGGTHLEMAQLMLERALCLLSDDGHLGLVLPRQSMVLAGWKNLRERLVTRHDLRIIQGRNHGEWIFDGIDPRLAVVLLSANPLLKGQVRIGVARSPKDITTQSEDNVVTFTPADLATLSETNVIPWFNQPEDRRVFDRIRKGPRLAGPDGWIRAVHDARWDFRGSGPDNGLVVREDTPGAWRVLMTGHVHAFAFDESTRYKQYVTDLPGATAKNRGVELDNGCYVLSERHPMIIVRHPSRSDDARTLIATALPETGVFHNKGYVHAVMHAAGTSTHKRLALLGLLNTLTVDWWVRRFADRHITAPVINQIPLPDWSQPDIEEAAALTQTLLARHGAVRLSGGITVTEVREGTDVALRAQLDRLALQGYGLDIADLTLIAEDSDLLK